MQVVWGAATDRGRIRRTNEDALLAEPPFFLVSDGMGGHAAGDVAAAIVVEEFRGIALGVPVDAAAGTGLTPAADTPDPALDATITLGASTDGATLAERIAAAADAADEPQTVHSAEAESIRISDCIRRASGRIRGGLGGGATVVGAAVVTHAGRPHWLAFNIGDSRAYRLSGGALSQISIDHSYVQELVDSGQISPADAHRHPKRHVITRAVGLAGGDGDPDCWLIPGRLGDRLLLCSDGVTTELDDAAVGAVLATHPDPQLAADTLVRAAVQSGGRDNATALVVDVIAISVDDVDTARSARATSSSHAGESMDDTAPRSPAGSEQNRLHLESA